MSMYFIFRSKILSNRRGKCHGAIRMFGKNELIDMRFSCYGQFLRFFFWRVNGTQTGRTVNMYWVHRNARITYTCFKCSLADRIVLWMCALLRYFKAWVWVWVSVMQQINIAKLILLSHNYQRIAECPVT